MAGWSPVMKKGTVEKQQGLLGRLRPWILSHLGMFDLENFSPEIAVDCLFQLHGIPAPVSHWTWDSAGGLPDVWRWVSQKGL